MSGKVLRSSNERVSSFAENFSRNMITVPERLASSVVDDYQPEIGAYALVREGVDVVVGAYGWGKLEEVP